MPSEPLPPLGPPGMLMAERRTAEIHARVSPTERTEALAGRSRDTVATVALACADDADVRRRLSECGS